MQPFDTGTTLLWDTMIGQMLDRITETDPGQDLRGNRLRVLLLRQDTRRRATDGGHILRDGRQAGRSGLPVLAQLHRVSVLLVRRPELRAWRVRCFLARRTSHPVEPDGEIATTRTAEGELSIHHNQMEPYCTLKNTVHHRGA